MSTDVQINPTQSFASLVTYKSYIAFLTQEDTNAPVATVINEDDANFIGNIVWGRLEAGLYTGTLPGAFPAGKTAMFFGNTSVCFISGGRSNDNVVTVQTNNPDNTRDDWNLNETPIEIRVYQ